MKLDNSKLAILSSVPVFPEVYGASLRTCNIAKLASAFFHDVTLFSQTSAMSGIEGNVSKGNLSIIQKKKPINRSNKYLTHFKRILSCGSVEHIPWEKKMILSNDILQIESPYFYDFIKKTNKKYILDQHNIYWDFEIENNITNSYLYNKIILKLNKKKEFAAIDNANHILVTSEIDKKKILVFRPDIADKITVIPNCVNLKTLENSQIITKRKKIVLFLGLLYYFPNQIAVKSICEQIAPKFDDDVDFIIIGKGGDMYKNHPKNVKFLGYINDTTTYLNSANVCIAPLIYGSGTRIKILEYMAASKPVISTSKGAEGIEYTNKENIIIEDNIDNFADIINELLIDEERACAIGKSGAKLVKEKYDWKLYCNTLRNVYETVLRPV